MPSQRAGDVGKGTMLGARGTMAPDMRIASMLTVLWTHGESPTLLSWLIPRQGQPLPERYGFMIKAGLFIRSGWVEIVTKPLNLIRSPTGSRPPTPRRKQP